MKIKKKDKIAIVGVGYVGMPLFFELSNYFHTVGFDINKKKINELRKGLDRNLQFSKKDLKKVKNFFSYSVNDLKDCNIYIVCVPTPLNNNKKPDLRYLKNSCKLISQILKRGDLIIFESTVFPGCTEEICIPLIEKISSLKLNQDFMVGYSPERVNPGDKKKKIKNIKKIVSGSSLEALKKIKNIYSRIVKAGIHVAPSIKVAEAAKILENVQRSINISLINEAAVIFNKLNIETKDVLEAASTKWNFLKYQPGLVGGHCIAVDPYYLTYKANQINLKPKLILSGQKINENIPIYIAKKVLKKINKNNIKLKKILILGFTFKENCADTRDSKVINIINYIKRFKNSHIDVFDPWVSKSDTNKLYIQCNFLKNKNFLNRKNFYDAIIVAVAHNYFKKIGFTKIYKLLKTNGVFFDVKSIFRKKGKNINSL